MPDILNTIASSRRIQIEYLLIDIEVAFTFLDCARTTVNAETRERNLRNARTAYDSVEVFAGRPILRESDLNLVWERLAELKATLQLA